MDLAFLSEDRLEIWIENGDLRKCLKTLIVPLGFFEDFSAAQQCLQVLGVATLLFVEHLLEESHGLVLEIVLHCRQIDPAADSLSIEVQIVLLEALIDDLSCFFELANVPHKCRCRYQVAIVSHLFALVHRQHKCVNRLLVDISAPFVVEYECLSRCVLDLPPVLHSGKFANRLVDVTFVENSVAFPEYKYWVCTLL
mgnify:CR=1 FL=1